MVRHDPHGYNGEPDPPGTPGVRALGAMAAAAQRAREVQEGGPPTHAVEIRFDDEPRPPRPAGTPSRAPDRRPAGAAHSRSPCGSPPPCSWWRPAPWPSRSERAGAGEWRRIERPTPDRGTHRGARRPARQGRREERRRGRGLRAASSSRVRVRAARPRPPRRPCPTPAARRSSPRSNPASGSAGQAIQVAGANFLSSSGQIIATFDGQVAPTSCPAQNTCSVTVPPPPSGTQSAQVVITTAGGTSNTVTFTYS